MRALKSPWRGQQVCIMGQIPSSTACFRWSSAFALGNLCANLVSDQWGHRMDFDGLLKSVVAAAAISGTVAAIGFLVSSATALRINKDKLKLDRELAKEKAATERDQAENAARLNRRLAIANRKSEVAEKALTDFYRAKRAFEVIRSPMIWASEMVHEDGVEDDVIRNEGYGVIRRMRGYSSLFSELEATRYTFGALFGQESTAPFDSIIRVYNRVSHAAESLLKNRHISGGLGDPSFGREMRRQAFSSFQLDQNGNEIPDDLAIDISSAVAKIEAICRPALEDKFSVLSSETVAPLSDI